MFAAAAETGIKPPNWRQWRGGYEEDTGLMDYCIVIKNHRTRKGLVELC